LDLDYHQFIDKKNVLVHKLRQHAKKQLIYIGKEIKKLFGCIPRFFFLKKLSQGLTLEIVS